MVDTMIVGHVLGDNSLAAVGSAASIYELLVGFGMGLANGMTIVTARAGAVSGSRNAKRNEISQRDREKSGILSPIKNKGRECICR